MSSEKGNGTQPSYRQMEAAATAAGHGTTTRDEGILIREAVRQAARDDEVDKEVRKYWSGKGTITGVTLFDVHHAMLVLIEADATGVLSKIAQRPGGEGHIYSQMKAVYGKYYEIKGSALRTARLAYQPTETAQDAG